MRTQLTFPCSKSSIKTLEKVCSVSIIGVQQVNVNYVEYPWLWHPDLKVKYKSAKQTLYSYEKFSR